MLKALLRRIVELFPSALPSTSIPEKPAAKKTRGQTVSGPLRSVDESGIHQRPYGRTLDAIASYADRTEGVLKTDLSPGDWVLVTTKNSVYSICALGGDTYSVSGGWFDREGISPHNVRIDGCTWGGNAIKSDIVAAKGLFLGFGNSVTTTRIKDIRVYRSTDMPAVI
ncbi:MAG: hypothetical protein JSU96_18215 [Acidobacteriota bacterium]|nr:MAG: hypothetical protein JSU96_18215 [Acidobacteriota bacterium]